MARQSSKKQPPTDPPKVETEVRTVDPRQLAGRDKNARFMTAVQMKQLVENIQRDGGLTSLPLVYQRAPDAAKLEIISGHHRVEAAIKAGLAEIQALVIVSEVDEKRLVAIQLSHNAITGSDDRSILAELYAELDLDTRKYSGLTDDMLGGFDKLGLASLGVGGSLYEDLHISFLPDDREQFLAFLKRIGSKAKEREVLVARFVDFDDLFETLIRVKTSMNVQNVGIAMCLMAELASERLDQIEAEQKADGRDDETLGGAGNSGAAIAGPADDQASRGRAAGDGGHPEHRRGKT